MKLVLTIFLLSTLLVASLQDDKDYDPKKAFEMLRASSAAYCTDSQLKNMDCGSVCKDLKGYTYLLQYIYQLPKGETISYSLFVNPTTKRFVASFRGSLVSLQIIDAIINGGSTTYDLYKITNAVTTKYFYDNYKDHMRDSFLADLKKYIAAYPGYDFHIVGHSMGGAFATLAVLDVALGGLLPKDKLNLYNYGCPRVGNVNFVRAVQQNVGGELFRIVHYKDMVPHVPPCRVNTKNQCQEAAAFKEIEENGDPNPLYYAWHVAPEIFYDIQDSTTFMYCNKNEAPNCSNQYRLIETNILDHLNYLGVNIACGGRNALGEEEIQGVVL